MESALKHRRKAHTKSRRGCTECKQRHIKCSETLPRCHSCIRIDVECVRPDKPQPRRSPARPHLSPDSRQSAQPSPATSSNAHLSVILNQDSPVADYAYSPAPSPGAIRSPVTPSAHSSHSDGGLGLLPVDELELLHHWTISTASTLGTMPPYFHLWQDTMVRLGFQYTYLLDGMLALAAVHKATTCPDMDRDRYIRLSSQHMDRGLQIYRSLIGKVDSDAFAALFCFGSILTIHHLALTQVQEPPDLIVYMCEWFHLMSGLSTIIKPHWEGMQASPIGALILDATRTIGSENTTFNDVSMLDGLKSAINYMPGRTEKETDEKQACEHALEELTKIIPPLRAGVAEGQSALAVVMSWPALVSARFRTMLMERHPTALGLLEQWIGLLERCKGSWWTAGWEQRVRNAIG